MKRLVILRHAKSSWANSSQDDWERPLNARGMGDAPRAGQWLRDRAIVPDVIVTSDAVRARATADAVAAVLDLTGNVVPHPGLYLAAPGVVLEVLREVAGDANVAMVVGHNPGLEDLVEALTRESHTMVTAGLVVVDLPIDRWSELEIDTGGSMADSWQPRD